MVEAACNLGLSLLLVRPWGLAGVAAGTVIPAVVFNVGFAVPHSAGRIGVRMSRVATHVLAPQVLPAIAAGAACFALPALPGSTTLLRLLSEAAVVGAVYWAVYVTVSADAAERESLRKVARGLRGRRTASDNND
jgi:hypothetical protein